VAHAQLHTVLGHIRRLAAPQATGCLTDAQLLERFLLRHDQAAFAALVKRHGPLVQKVCWRVLHHAQDVEDAFQATFLVLARNAASIRKPETLACWLHGAGYRTALRVKRDAGRRRHHEREAPRVSHSQPPLDAAWRELQAILDEEIANLPEKYRVVFVLCCLESKSKPEAAGQLGLKEGTVSSRLAHARKLMQQRLTRRGLTLSAVLGAAAVAEQSGMAAPPVALVRAATKAALAFHTRGGEAVSPKIKALAEGVSKAMTITNFKTATMVLLSVGFLAAGAGALALRHAAAVSAPPAARQPSKPPAEPPQAPAARREAGKPERAAAGRDTLTVSGRVLNPKGEPFAGAEVTLWWLLGYEGYYRMWHPRTVQRPAPRFGTTSGADGRFRFTFAPSEIDDGPLNMWDGWWKSTQVVAAAKGYGPGWRLLGELDKGELTVQLVEDNAPVKGRIVDLQGRPVAGARARVIHLDRGTDFIKDFLWQTTWAGLSTRAPTDKDVEFTLTGLGGGRTALVLFEGPRIAHQFAAIPTLGQAEKPGNAMHDDVVVNPTKPIEGTIRAKDTGKPLAGVVVYGDEDGYRREVRAVTDRNGRYRLVGLPKAAQYQLTVYCPWGQSYLGTFRNLADNEGLKPITADFELRRGIPVELRMIDKETRRPVRGTVQYSPLESNPLYREAEWQPGLAPTREFQRIHMPNPKGVFRLVAYPGPGIVIAWAKYGRPYLPARPTPAETERYIKGTFTLDGFLDLSEGYHILDTDKTDKPLTFDIELDPGRALKGKLIGPDSRPVSGARADGLNYLAEEARHGQTRGDQLLPTEEFTALRLDARTPRTISFVHRERKLIGHAVVRGDEKGPLAVRLEPWGTLTGRLIDEQGKPLAGVRVDLRGPSLPAPGLGSLQEFRTDRDGRFRVEGLLPGMKHELTLTGEPAKKVTLTAGDRIKGLSARSGEIKDLGDIPVKDTSGSRP
jgi:RNA polymerase sigma factor (sigma-70 family)